VVVMNCLRLNRMEALPKSVAWFLGVKAKPVLLT